MHHACVLHDAAISPVGAMEGAFTSMMGTIIRLLVSQHGGRLQREFGSGNLASGLFLNKIFTIWF